MKKSFISFVGAMMMAAVCGTGNTAMGQVAQPATKPAQPAVVPSGHEKTSFRVGYSIYTGWEFWEYLRTSGIMDKWAAQYGIKIELVPYNTDYMKSVSEFSTEGLDAVTVTNMDTLTGPALSTDTTVIIVGDYSNGNDVWLTRNGRQLSDMKGVKVIMCDDSVSEYLAYRAFEVKGKGLTLADLGGIINMTDSKISSELSTDNGATAAAVTWEPIVTTAKELKGPSAVTPIVTSAEIPEEILDMLLAHTKVAAKNPDFCKAVTGAFYEALAITYPGREKAGVNAKADEAIGIMAKHCEVTPEQFRKMLGTTAMYWTPANAAAFTKSETLRQRMTTVRNTCLALAKLGAQNNSNGIGIGVNPRELASVGISFPDGSVIGPKGSVRIRFDATYMQAAADGLITRK